MSGEPGTGKTWLMSQLTDGWLRTPLPPERGTAPARDLLTSRGGRVLAVELGRQRPGGYSGTDALPSAVIGDACTYLSSGRADAEAPLVLAEGARLANRRFLYTAAAVAEVTLVCLVGPEVAAARRAARAAALGIDLQNPSWVQGRRTAAEHLAAELDTEPGITVCRADAAEPPVKMLRALLSPPG